MMEVDGFILGENTRFTSIDDQAGQALAYVKEHLDGGKTYGEYLLESPCLNPARLTEHRLKDCGNTR